MKRILLVTFVVAVVVLALVLWPGSEETSGTTSVASAERQAKGKLTGRSAPGNRQRPWQEIIQDDDPVGSLRLEGQVLDVNDLPVDGALVTISTNPGRTTAAERDGTFGFDRLIGKRYRLTARKGNLVGGPVSHRLTGASEPVIIRVGAGSVVEVTVVTAGRRSGNRPVAGAAVELRSAGIQQGETGTDGIVRFEGVAAGFCSLVVQAEGFSPVQDFLAVPRGAKDATRIQIVLKRGVRVSGRVVTETDEPVSDARVVAGESGALFPRVDEDTEHARTDDQGRFVIPALAVGNHRLTAYHPDHPPASTEPLTISGPMSGVTIVMAAGASVEGRVVTRDNAAAPWAGVRLQEAERRFRFGRRQRRTTADQDGTFRFTGLPREQVDLMALAEKASSPVVSVDLKSEPATTGVMLRLTREGRIAGKVMDSRGQPAAEVYVTARADFLSGEAPDDMRIRRGTQALTDGGGHFAFEGLSEGAYRLMASRIQVRERGRFMARRGVRARTGDEDVELTIEDAGGIRGSVVLAGGGVPERFGVTVDFRPAVPFDDPGGVFEVTPVHPGEHLVTIRGDDFADVNLPDVEVKSGETTDLGEIVIQPGRVVSGRVVDRQGRPVEGAAVMIDRFLIGDGTRMGSGFRGGEFEESRTVQTDADGAFRVESVSTESRMIVAEHAERGRSDAVRIPAGKEEPVVELVLNGFGSVTGLVTSGVAPLAEARVMARAVGGSGSMIMVSTGADGRYLIEKVPEGEHKIEATRSGGWARGRTSLRKNVTVQADTAAQADFQFDSGEATLVVDVRGQGGAAIDFAFVNLFQGQVAYTNAQELFSTHSEFQGTVRSSLWFPGRPARFAQLVPDAYTVCVVPLAGELTDFRRMRKLRERANQLRVHCFPHPVADTAEEQMFTPEVAPMAPLPEDLSEPEEEVTTPQTVKQQPAQGPAQVRNP